MVQPLEFDDIAIDAYTQLLKAISEMSLFKIISLSLKFSRDFHFANFLFLNY